MDAPLTFETLREAIKKAVEAWSSVGSDDHDSLGFLLLVKRRRIENPHDGQPTKLRYAANSILDDALQELERLEKAGVKPSDDKKLFSHELFRESYLNNVDARKLARTYGFTRDHIFRLRGKAIDKITQIILDWELQVREEIAFEIEKTFPPKTYRELFGIQKAKEMVIEQLRNPSSYRIIALTGIGGIGKTALAQEVCQAIVRDFYFDKIIWLRAERKFHLGKQAPPDMPFDELMIALAKKLLPEQDHLYQRATRIRHQLNSAPHLIVIDDLETEGEIHTIITEISKLDVQGKFVLTSRAHPNLSDVFSLPLTELPADETKLLIRHLADERESNRHVIFSEKDLETIYETVGGNPLAIRMVVDLAKDVPLSVILEDIPRGEIAKTEEIYVRIYRKAWEELSKEARTLLMVMPMVARNGATFEQLEAISQLKISQITKAIPELRHRSLLEVLYNQEGEMRYVIHRLTENFIRSEILKGPTEE